MYLYTNVDGHITKKPLAMQNFAKIHEQFLSIADSFKLTNNPNMFVATTQSCGKSPVMLNIEEFNKLCLSSTIPNDLEILQCFIPSKGNTSTCCTFRYVYAS